jgi:hypothetical protein
MTFNPSSDINKMPLEPLAQTLHGKADQPRSPAFVQDPPALWNMCCRMEASSISSENPGRLGGMQATLPMKCSCR